MARFIKDFRSIYCNQQINSSTSSRGYDDEPLSPPPFLNCTYAQAVSQARRELKFLLVFLHNNSFGDSVSFCRNVIGVKEFHDFLRGDGEKSSSTSSRHSILLWGCNVTCEEGFTVSQILGQEYTFPFIGVIAQMDGEMALVGRIEGRVDKHPSTLIGKLKVVMKV